MLSRGIMDVCKRSKNGSRDYCRLVVHETLIIFRPANKKKTDEGQNRYSNNTSRPGCLSDCSPIMTGVETSGSEQKGFYSVL